MPPIELAMSLRSSEPAVSIITPAFNADRFLAEAVASVRAQTFGDFELLIVDDGSTDSTLTIAKEFQALDGRIRVFTRPNGGISAARNTALREARGRIFALLDSDDVWMPRFLEMHVALFDRFRVDVVTNNALNLGGSVDGKPVHARTPRSRYQRITLLDMITREDAVCVLAIFRREVYDAIGGFDESLKRNEDYQFWIRAARAGFAILETTTPLAFYRRRPDSVSANDLLMLEGIADVLRQARVLCCDDHELSAVIDRQLVSLERRRLIASAKAHLTRREYEAAAVTLEAVHRLDRTLCSALVARMSRRIPQGLLWAYRLKTALRPIRLRAL